MGGSSSNTNDISNNNVPGIRCSSGCLIIKKILVVGDCGTGKTCLITRFALDDFYEGFRNTIGIDFRLKKLQLDGRNTKVLIWDTYQPYWFRGILNSTFGGCTGVIIVYDVTNQESFNNLGKWLKQIDDISGENNIDKMIIGNKCDLTTQRVVQYNTAKEFADKHGIPLVEASAKTAINVNQAFVGLIAAIKKRMSRHGICLRPLT